MNLASCFWKTDFLGHPFLFNSSRKGSLGSTVIILCYSFYSSDTGATRLVWHLVIISEEYQTTGQYDVN